MKVQFYISVFMTFLFFSCEKIFIKGSVNDPATNFEEMWITLDERYSFFTYKNVDWNAIRYKYESEINEQMSDEELFKVLSTMLFELHDGHVDLHSDFNISRYSGWYLNYPDNFDFNIIKDNYLKDDYYVTGHFLNTIIDSIGYVYYGSFSSKVSGSQVDYIINRFKNLKGVIIDVRNNTGGYIESSNILASRFADKKRHSHNILLKKGTNHDDFYNPVSYFIEPGGEYQFTKKVIVLSNRRCYSTTTQFIQSMRVFPHVTIMGDTCGGGGGTPISYELPNGWIYRFSSDMMVAPDDFNLEHGIPPDIYVSMDSTNAEKGIDDIIERALDELK